MEKNSDDFPLYFLSDRLEFPPVHLANEDGLLAVGGDLSTERLLLAYQSGIFPWFNDDDLILWWSPDPRMVLFPEKVRISKSMRKVLAKSDFVLSVNQHFEAVVEQCASLTRKGQKGTWITDTMKEAYIGLCKKGFARSYEVSKDGELVGGWYGVDLGHVFCGESMFSKVTDASKFAFIQMAQELQRQNYQLIDCQVHTAHLQTLGAELIPRPQFMDILKEEAKF